MKKKLLTLSAAVLATVALSSCTPKVNDDVEAIETTKINVWATAAEQQVVEEVIKNMIIGDTISYFQIDIILKEKAYNTKRLKTNFEFQQEVQKTRTTWRKRFLQA